MLLTVWNKSTETAQLLQICFFKSCRHFGTLSDFTEMYNNSPHTYLIPKWGVPVRHIGQQGYQAEAEALCDWEGTWSP